MIAPGFCWKSASGSPDDLTFTTRVYEALYPQNPAFDSAAILALPWGRWEGEPLT